MKQTGRSSIPGLLYIIYCTLQITPDPRTIRVHNTVHYLPNLCRCNRITIHYLYRTGPRARNRGTCGGYNEKKIGYGSVDKRALDDRTYNNNILLYSRQVVGRVKTFSFKFSIIDSSRLSKIIARNDILFYPLVKYCNGHIVINLSDWIETKPIRHTNSWAQVNVSAFLWRSWNL